MKPETVFSHWLKKHLSEIGIFERIENCAGVGTFDILFTHRATGRDIWIETKIYPPVLRKSQVVWWSRRAVLARARNQIVVVNQPLLGTIAIYTQPPGRAVFQREKLNLKNHLPDKIVSHDGKMIKLFLDEFAAAL